MDADREFDMEVAQKVMGWRPPAENYTWSLGWEPIIDPNGHRSFVKDIPEYSRSIAAAWLIIEHFRQQGKAWLIETNYEYAELVGQAGTPEARTVKTPNLYRVRNCEWNHIWGEWDTVNGWGEAIIDEMAETLPLAICRAALSAIEELVPA